MPHSIKAANGCRPHPLTGRVRGYPIRMLGLYLLQLPKQLIILGIRDERVIEGVITVIVMGDFFFECFQPFFHQSYSQAKTFLVRLSPAIKPASSRRS